jgi:hypothetical protein
MTEQVNQQQQKSSTSFWFMCGALAIGLGSAVIALFGNPSQNKRKKESSVECTGLDHVGIRPRCASFVV